jgi:hypothetical protein
VSDEQWTGGGCTRQVANMYRDGIAYAVTALAAAAPDTALYVDAGHGGWVTSTRGRATSGLDGWIAVMH